MRRATTGAFMRIISLTLISALLGSTALPALAADLAVVIPNEQVLADATVTDFDWSGLSIGVHAGAAMQGVEYDDFVDVEHFNWAQPGGQVGLSVGYDAELGSRVVGGVELRYDYFHTEIAPYEPTVCCELLTVDDQISLTGRIGYLSTPETLLYLRAGVASVGLSVPVGFDDEIQKGRSTGALIGIGAESRLFDNITASVEARYFKATSTFLTEDEMEFFPKNFSVTAGLKYRFGDTGHDHADAGFDPIDFDFSGAYVGLSALGVASAMTRDITTPGATDGPFWDDAMGAGISLGYDFDVGDSFVLGGELSYDHLALVFLDPDQASHDVGATDEFAYVDSIAALSLRFGTRLNSATLLYAKAGVAAIQTIANEEFFALAGGGEETLPGVQLGLGIETAVADNVTLGVEGLYTTATDELVTDNTQLGQVALRPEILTGKVTLKFHF